MNQRLKREECGEFLAQQKFKGSSDVKALKLEATLTTWKGSHHAFATMGKRTCDSSLTDSTMVQTVDPDSPIEVLKALPNNSQKNWLKDPGLRRLNLAVSVIIASISQVAVKDHWSFFGLRVLAGLGTGTAQTAAPLLATEVAHPRQRQTATALYNACWCWGSIASAAISFATLYISSSWSWRGPCMLQAFFPLVQIVGLFFVPESPRWLVSKDRKQEALQILARYHANGDADDALVQHEFHQICNNINTENMQPGHWSTFFSSKGDLHRLSICVIVGLMQEWAGNGE
ncbi:hypothetical protein N7468_004084 [Penicillium chermesinum]|uniref:Major facilitator superfamily (MFS) profile domain-containing protein n=1 Tax=Penicillium chermesinum TaxID=63820 RepID=A0A9W9P7T7_9EURO|nr:uncharacterized protein N7468_004084 [Penicillium chermesinum]KAJ5239465.1 hypothetical protein N7468_004084 [Penicillium chermesinum]